MMTTHAQMKHSVALALVDMGKDPALRAQRLTAEEVARRANVPVGHVRKIMKEDFGLQFGLGDTFVWTRPQFEAIEAHVLMPVSRTPAVNSQVINIGTNQGHVVGGDNHESTANNTVSNHGDNNQIAAGGDVTITYDQILNQLVRDVEASDLPPEKKRDVIDGAKELLKTGVLQGMKLAVGEMVKAAYTHSGSVAALVDQLGKVL
jgi:hypothetical protein